MTEKSEKKTTTKYFGSLYSGLKKKTVLKSDEGLAETKKYLKEAFATRGVESPGRPGKRAASIRANRKLNLGDD